MKKQFFLLLALLPVLFYGVQYRFQKQLEEKYVEACRKPSDIYEHLPILSLLAEESASVVEIGVRDMVSTWGLLRGLAHQGHGHPSYLGIDLVLPPAKNLRLAKKLAHKNAVAFDFWTANDLTITIPPTDLLFIDSLHTYCHLMSELERFSPQVRKYIVLHDTSAPWGDTDDRDYRGDYSEYPAYFDRTKRGLWPAVVDFLATHPEWELKERYLNNHGLTVLQRGTYGK